jgi:hypothetical protein
MLRQAVRQAENVPLTHRCPDMFILELSVNGTSYFYRMRLQANRLQVAYRYLNPNDVCRIWSFRETTVCTDVRIRFYGSCWHRYAIRMHTRPTACHAVTASEIPSCRQYARSHAIDVLRADNTCILRSEIRS